MTRTAITLGVSALIGLATLAHADEQAAIDGCIDQIRTVTGGLGGEVLSSSFSEAGTNVTLRDSEGTVWECIGYSDGTVGDLRVNEEAGADDGGGAMAGAPQTGDVQVRFAAGTTGATYSNSLGSGDAVRYLLGAQRDQLLTAELRGNSPQLDFIVYAPGGDILFESSQGGDSFTGALPENGEYAVEVFYNGNQGTTGSFDIVFEIN